MESVIKHDLLLKIENRKWNGYKLGLKESKLFSKKNKWKKLVFSNLWI